MQLGYSWIDDVSRVIATLIPKSTNIDLGTAQNPFRNVYYSGSLGNSETRVVTVSATTSDNTPTELTLDGEAPSGTNKILLPRPYTAAAYRITVVAIKQASASNLARWDFDGLIAKGATNASTVKKGGELDDTIIFSPFGSAVVETAADTTYGALVIRITGVAATKIKWVARVELAEVSYA